ncbi:ROK family transcriptional regulator [Thioclava sp. GXIMD4216]|uniref:ROK family transcriptional regulator n=1 Tax=Thioclava litoralis TaxID=3076557 RepID=A0ABZ1DZW4_9RHOB|nr:ROK family transcriptional regulator [Thioclava sp. FTW29]
MGDLMEAGDFIGQRLGVNHTGVRAHNERLVLSLIHRDGALPGAEIAKRIDLSAQTVSTILRKLETDGFLLRGTPQRGRVGKPSLPMGINPDGAISFGLKIGHRTSDLVMMALDGQVLAQGQSTYAAPTPQLILQFLRDGIAKMSQQLSPAQRQRLCGIGITAPLDLWRAVDNQPLAAARFPEWVGCQLIDDVARFSPLPVSLINDGTAACCAEQNYGRGREVADFAYVFLGSFLTGGISLNGTVVEGNRHNAGMLGALRILSTQGTLATLRDEASIFLLEAAIRSNGMDAGAMWQMPQDWTPYDTLLGPWLDRSAHAIAQAARESCAVVDFQAIVIDGAFPEEVRAELVRQVREKLAALDMNGLLPPDVLEARTGHNARAIGAAAAPIFSRFFLN